MGGMRHFNVQPFFTRLAFVCLCLSALFLASCETKEAKKSAKPPVQALAPTPQQPAPTPQAAPTPTPVQQVQSQEKPDAAAQTIAEAEKSFEAGQTDYKAGHLDAAKQDFNHAVDILMQGPVDIKSDARLQQEFDKITDEINKLEMVAFKAGDGFAEQQSEPAPIDEANTVTFAVDPNLKAKAEADLPNLQSDLPLMINDYVAGYINYFSTRGRDTFEGAMVRSGRYKEMIFRIFKEEGVPQDLIYLAQAESGFKPLALSRARARGMWQFMSSRGAGYGLHRSWWIDDRQDPEKATRAAARHLKDLYNQFGDWYLAMAAYNSGPGTVQAAVKRTGYADFWELYRRNALPRETRNYVPIILAMTIVSKNLSHYGFDDVSMEEPAKFDTVTINYAVDLRLVAECVNSTAPELQDLNPSLLRLTTPREGKFDLHLPAGTKDSYQTAIASIPTDMRLWWRFHTVQPGDTLASLARNYHTTAKSITAANHLDTTELDADAKLVIPV